MAGPYPPAFGTVVHMYSRVLVAGGEGTLGRWIAGMLGDSAVPLDLPELDITEPERVRRVVAAVAPDAIVNCAAITDVDLCQRRPELAMRVHRDGVKALAATGVRLLTMSSDHVFCGNAGPEPYLESSPASPVNEYGRSKLAGEALALEAGGTVVRTSWLFGLRRGMVPRLCRQLEAGGEVRAVTDQTACATWVADLARGIIGLLEEDVRGVVHMANSGPTSPLELAEQLSLMCGGGSVRKVRWEELGLDAPRPTWSVLGSERGGMLRPLEEALTEWRRGDGIGR